MSQKIKKKFTLNSITPQNLSDKLYSHIIKKDITFLLKKKSFFKNVSCPACNGRSSKFFMVKNGFNYKICNKCKTFFMTPRPTEAILTDFYYQSKTYDFYNKYIFPAGEKSRYKNINVPRVQKIKQILTKRRKKNANLIDIGAGYGTFCKAASNDRYFKKVYALEPTPSGVKNCKRGRVIPIHLNFDQFFKTNKKFYDVITFFEVIEHLFDPNIFLKKISKILSKKGIIVFTCPNGQGFDVQLLKKYSDTIDHEHLNYFNLESIQEMLKKNNFKIIEICTPGKLDIDIIKAKISKKNTKIKLDFFYKKILDSEKLSDNFQKFITDNFLSSNMWVVAEKK